MSDNFKAGDLVYLKSNTNNPLMTINWIVNNVATCVWFVGDNDIRGDFRVETLIKKQDVTKKNFWNFLKI